MQNEAFPLQFPLSGVKCYRALLPKKLFYKLACAQNFQDKIVKVLFPAYLWCLHHTLFTDQKTVHNGTSSENILATLT